MMVYTQTAPEQRNGYYAVWFFILRFFICDVLPQSL